MLKSDGPLLTSLKKKRSEDLLKEHSPKKAKLEPKESSLQHRVELQEASSSSSGNHSKNTEKDTDSNTEKNNSKNSTKTSIKNTIKNTVKNSSLSLIPVDPYIDAENKEIARLEKLMGIKGGKHIQILLTCIQIQFMKLLFLELT